MSLRVMAWATWLRGDQAISDGASTGQLPDCSGASISSQPSCVEPLAPEWPSWQQIFASVSVWTKSTMRFHAASCAGAYIPVQPGVMRPSGLTQVISMQTRPAPPLARSP